MKVKGSTISLRDDFLEAEIHNRFLLWQRHQKLLHKLQDKRQFSEYFVTRDFTWKATMTIVSDKLLLARLLLFELF